MDAIVELSRMPANAGVARVRLVVDKSGIHVYLGEREVWIEVSEDGNLIARGYFDQHSEDAYTTMTILPHKIIVGNDHVEEKEK